MQPWPKAQAAETRHPYAARELIFGILTQRRCESVAITIIKTSRNEIFIAQLLMYFAAASSLVSGTVGHSRRRTLRTGL